MKLAESRSKKKQQTIVEQNTYQTKDLKTHYPYILDKDLEATGEKITASLGLRFYCFVFPPFFC